MKFTRSNNRKEMEWLPAFLKRTFFGACSVHQDNDLNRYCMSCHIAACKDCVASAGSHGEHNVLKIYRHVYKDVVPLEDMRSFINCDMIQPYRCNKKMVISLNPLPHCGSGKADNNSCRFCMRKLNDRDRDTYHYCSIACKYQVRHDPEEEEDPGEEAEPQKPKRHRRKGIPRRAAT